MTIPFHKQFKKGDIICSDSFHAGKCIVVVEGSRLEYADRFGYTCDDLIVEKQKWRAYEYTEYDDTTYNWRLATDDDIVVYLARYITTREESLNGIDVAITDDILTIRDVCGSVYMDMEQAAKLRDYLNKYVVGG
jgi:hypothetical protein